MWRFHLKLKNTCKILSEWSRNTVGNILYQVKDLEANLETTIIIDNFENNRATLNLANFLLIRAYKKEEPFWKQQSGVKWCVEDEVNSKFFHSVVNGRKKRLTLKKMKKDDDDWIEGDDDIANKAVDFFQKQFTREEQYPDFSILNCIPKLITDKDNNMLTATPTMDEVQVIVFSICPQAYWAQMESQRSFINLIGKLLRMIYFL